MIFTPVIQQSGGALFLPAWGVSRVKAFTLSVERQ
jgi:hypothetical protein